MGVDAGAFLERWHRIVAEKDVAALSELLAEDVSVGAPPYWTKVRGRKIVEHLLGIIIETIEGFTYHREWLEGSELALEFTGRVGDLDLQGIDLISLDEEGQVRNVDVLVRPVNAVITLQKIVGPRMEAFLAGASGGQAAAASPETAGKT
jgi:hypothetical protein